MIRKLSYILLALQAVLLARHGFAPGGFAPAAIVFMEGFDYWDPSSTAAPPHAWSVGQTKAWPTGRFGGHGFSNSRTSGSGLVTTVAFPSTSTTMIVGWAQNNLAAASYVEILTAANAVVASVRNNGSGQPAVYNAAGSLVASGTSGAVTGWNYYEVKIFANGASGTCELHVNGVVDIASTTGNFGSTAIGALGLFIASGTSISMDDIYAADTTGASPRNTFLGDVRVATIMPTGAGSHTQFSANGAATNWGCVSEQPPDDDTTYVADSTPGDLDSYACADIDGGSSVFGVQVNIRARKDDAGARQIAPLIRQASTDYIGSTATLGASYGYASQIYNQDPVAADWIPSVVNADEFGVKEIA